MVITRNDIRLALMYEPIEDVSGDHWHPVVTLTSGIRALKKGGSPTHFGNALCPVVESAAYEVAEAMGLGWLVPVTVQRDGCSLQEWVDDAYTAGEHGGTESIKFLDHVLGNSDRHGGNWLRSTTNNRKVWAIDHGCSFNKRSLEHYGNPRDCEARPNKVHAKRLDGLLRAEWGIRKAMNGLPQGVIDLFFSHATQMYVKVQV